VCCQSYMMSPTFVPLCVFSTLTGHRKPHCFFFPVLFRVCLESEFHATSPIHTPTCVPIRFVVFLACCCPPGRWFRGQVAAYLWFVPFSRLQSNAGVQSYNCKKVPEALGFFGQFLRQQRLPIGWRLFCFVGQLTFVCSAVGVFPLRLQEILENNFALWPSDGTFFSPCCVCKCFFDCGQRFPQKLCVDWHTPGTPDQCVFK